MRESRPRTAPLATRTAAYARLRPVVQQYRRTAFQTYDESLRQSLQLCVDGMNLVDCNAAPHVGPPGAVQP